MITHSDQTDAQYVWVYCLMNDRDATNANEFLKTKGINMFVKPVQPGFIWESPPFAKELLDELLKKRSMGCF